MNLLRPSVASYLQSKRRYPLARRYDSWKRNVVNLASNESAYGPSPKVISALRREIRLVGRYPDPGCSLVKRNISRYLKVREKNICVGNGSDELINLICTAFVEGGDKCLIPIPSFAIYEIASTIGGGLPEFFPLREFRWDEKELLRAARGAKIAFVGRPNNPTGNSLSIETLDKLANRVGLLVIDEAYGEFSGSSSVPLATRRKNIVVLKTFSKAFGLAGLRIGYAVGSPTLVEVLEDLRAPFNVNRFAQAGAIAALNDLGYMREVVKKIQNQREWLFSELSNLGLKVFPSESNFLMVSLRPWKVTAPKVCSTLAKRGIFIRELTGFRGAGENFVRITVGTPWQNKKLVAALKRMRREIGWRRLR